MKLRMVKFIRLKPRMDSHETVLELFMNDELDIIEGGALTPYGEKLLDKLKTSSIKVSGEELSFLDKEKYLRNLEKEYTSPYLYATPYKNQDSELNYLPEGQPK